jgi:hypothetical protein
MAVTLKSTKAKVREPEKMRALLASWKWKGMEINLQEEKSGWTLEMAYHEGDVEGWQLPVALRIEDLPSEDEYPGEDAFFEAEDEVYDEKGGEGFLTFLRELAAYLESPLLILVAVGLSGLDYWAKVWRVEPGAKEVQTLKT